MRPSKFRFPERTAPATRFPFRIPSAIGSGSGPDFPMQVVQPYPTRWNPAPSIAGGWEVFVQLVTAATTADPSTREKEAPRYETGTPASPGSPGGGRTGVSDGAPPSVYHPPPSWAGTR